MLDPATGEVVLATTSLRLGPRLTRAAFLASATGSQATPGTSNPPWRQYGTVFASGEVGPFPADVTLQFQDDVLEWVTIMNLGAAFGTSWDDWSREREDLRRRAHDDWLRDSGLPPGKYPFGEVWSDYSEKDALSRIVIRYAGGTRSAWRERLRAWSRRAGWGRRDGP